MCRFYGSRALFPAEKEKNEEQEPYPRGSVLCLYYVSPTDDLKTEQIPLLTFGSRQQAKILFGSTAHKNKVNA